MQSNIISWGHIGVHSFIVSFVVVIGETKVLQTLLTFEGVHELLGIFSLSRSFPDPEEIIREPPCFQITLVSVHISSRLGTETNYYSNIRIEQNLLQKCVFSPF